MARTCHRSRATGRRGGLGPGPYGVGGSRRLTVASRFAHSGPVPPSGKDDMSKVITPQHSWYRWAVSPPPQPRSRCVSAVCIHVVTINSTDRWEEWRFLRGDCQDQDSLPRIQTAENVFLTISRDSLRCMSASIDQNEALNAALLLNMVI